MSSDSIFIESRLARRSYIDDSICVWINSNFDDKSRSQFEKIFPASKIFENIDEFMKVINYIQDEKIFLILSQSINQQMIKSIDDSSQINSVYTFGSINTIDQHLIKQSKKFKENFTEIETISNKLKEDMLQCESNITEFDLIPPNVKSNSISKDTNIQEANFMYAQLFNEIVTKLEYSELDEKEMIDYLRFKYSNNNSTLKLIDQFESEYKPETSIFWYTKNSIFYQIVNKGLRMQNIDILYSMRVFIKNLYQQLVELYQNTKETQDLKLYRGQSMLNEDFQQIKNNVGGLLSFTSFLSTSKSKDVASIYLESTSDKKTTILFEITVDPTTHSNVSYADITDSSSFGIAEKEYLFSMGSVFRIETIDVDNTGLYHVHLSLTSENDKQLTDLTKHMGKQYISNPPSMCDIAAILYKKGNYIKAKQICEKILLVEKNSLVQANIYNKLGLYTRSLGDLDNSLFYYEESLKKFEEGGIKDGYAIGIVFTNIARVYKEKKDFTRALYYNEQALYNYNLESNPDQESIALIHNNIGVLHLEQNNFSTALDHHVKSLKLRLQLPMIHPDIAQSLNNIGMLYDQQGKNENALFFFILALEIKKRSMYPDDPSNAKTLNNISVIFIRQNKIKKAREYLIQAITIAEKSLGPNHEDTQNYRTRLETLMNK